MLPTASPFVTCWKNCSMGSRRLRKVVGPRPGGPTPCSGLLLQDEVAGGVHGVDAVQLADPVALVVEGDLAGEAREVLQPGGEIPAQLPAVGRLGGLDGLHDDAEAVAREDAVDGAGRLAVLLL